jgi:hypothetical protein
MIHHRWKVDGYCHFWKDEYTQIRPSDSGSDLSEVLLSLEKVCDKESNTLPTYLLLIPKPLVRGCSDIEQGVLAITQRRFRHYEDPLFEREGKYSFYWSLNIFKNYKPYRDWFNSRARCLEDIRINNRTSAIEFAELIEEFFRYLNLKGFA